MKDDDPLPVSTPTATSIISSKKESSSAVSAASAADHWSLYFGRGRYKFWALAAILLLAFWSMLTGTVTLRISSGDLNNISSHGAIDISLSHDFDALELEEREKLVKHMWEVYNLENRPIRLAKFWENAFHAAYGQLISDEAHEREAAVTEIAKMSFRHIRFEPPPAVRSLAARRHIKQTVRKL